MSATKAKQTYRVVIGGILLVLGLVNLYDIIDSYYFRQGDLVPSILFIVIGLVFLLKYFSARSKSKPKGS
jgi:uncharacterized membrane protein HdeD (DUF308 family)